MRQLLLYQGTQDEITPTKQNKAADLSNFKDLLSWLEVIILSILTRSHLFPVLHAQIKQPPLTIRGHFPLYLKHREQFAILLTENIRRNVETAWSRRSPRRTIQPARLHASACSTNQTHIYSGAEEALQLWSGLWFRVYSEGKTAWQTASSWERQFSVWNHL